MEMQKIADLGVSHKKNNLFKMFSLVPARGTPCYMAPEVLDSLCNNKKAPISIKADIYSLGNLIYFMLTRQDPNLGSNKEADLRDKLLKNERPAAIEDDWSELLCKILKMCWENDASKRPTCE